MKNQQSLRIKFAISCLATLAIFIIANDEWLLLAVPLLAICFYYGFRLEQLEKDDYKDEVWFKFYNK